MTAVLAILLLGVKKTCFNKQPLSRLMFNTIIPAGISAIAHVVVLVTANPLVAKIFYALYFASSTWISVSVFNFCVFYSELKFYKKIFRYIVIPLSVVDSLSIFVNAFLPFLYTIKIVHYGSNDYFRYQASLLFIIHVVFGYILLLWSAFILFRKSRREPRIFKPKYVSLLVFIILILLANIIYTLLDFPLNFSIYVYALCFVGAYFVVNKRIPLMLIQKTLGLIVDNLKNGIILLDNEGKCIYVNNFIKELFFCNEKNILDLDVLSDFNKKKELTGMSEETSFSDEFEYCTDSTRLVLQISDFCIKENDVAVGKYYLIEDITIAKNQIYEEKMLRTRDKLTSLYNKEYFIEKVEHRLKYDRFTSYYLIVSDIVNFKLINDLHGKAFGDMVLKRISDDLRKYAAPDDIYARLYNDHFILLVPKRHFDSDTYIGVFKNGVSYLNNFSYTLVGHLGIYEVDDLSLPVSVMCDRAFLALKTIKNDYKSDIAYYDDKLRLEVLQMQMLMNELPEALKSGQVQMYLQPQVKENGELVGAEALVRWHHPTKGLIPPSDFIQIIEKINIISDVDRYVWECACKKLAEWKANGNDNLSISVNISAKDFFTMDLYETFTGLVKKYDIAPKNLNLEITETAVIMDIDNQIQLLDRLRNAGFVVEMDDFGSGYSSLNMLKDICVDVLKIDMAFLQKSKNDEKSHIILEQIIRLAKELGMKVLTEGVETESHVEFLSQAGCDLFQGFYFSRPISVADFEEKYLNRK